MSESRRRDRVLSGPEKAAALLLMLGAATAGRLLKHFDPPDIKVVARAAAGLGAVAPVTLDRLVEEFSADFSARRQSARRPRTGSQPPRRSASARRGRRFHRLGARRGASLTSGARSPRSRRRDRRLPDRRAARDRDLYPVAPRPARSRRGIVSALPRDRRNAALCGLIAPHAISSRAAELVEDGLARPCWRRAPPPAGGSRAARASPASSTTSSPKRPRTSCGRSAKTRPKDAAVLKTMLFTFNDLPRLSDRARALLFDRASIDIVVMALRGTDPDFRNAVLSSMPSRGRRLVEGELASGASAPARDVAKARKAIADIVLGMAARNEIELGAPPEDEAA